MTTQEEERLLKYFKELFPDFVCGLCKSNNWLCNGLMKIDILGLDEKGQGWHSRQFNFVCNICGWSIFFFEELFKKYYEENRKSTITKVLDFLK